MPKRRKTDSEVDASPELTGQTTVANPDRDRIALRAYELYLARGAVDGLAEDDWYTAERELNAETSSTRES